MSKVKHGIKLLKCKKREVDEMQLKVSLTPINTTTDPSLNCDKIKVFVQGRRLSGQDLTAAFSHRLTVVAVCWCMVQCGTAAQGIMVLLLLLRSMCSRSKHQCRPSDSSSSNIMADCSLPCLLPQGFYSAETSSQDKKPYLSTKDFGTAIHSLLTSQLDYCNSLYAGVEQASPRRL